MKLHGYTRAIKTYAKQKNILISDNKGDDDTKVNNIIKRNNQGSKKHYEILIHKIDQTAAYKKWENKFNKEIKWNHIFKNVNSIQEIKIKWFQLKICHRVIVTNTLLEKMNVTDTNSCTFCNRERDTALHYLWGCPKIQHFWRDFTNNLKQACRHCDRLQLNNQLVILGNDGTTQTDKGFDFILLHAKYFIYRSKLNKVEPNINTFKTYLKQAYEIDKFTFKIEMKMSKFNEKWAPYLEFIE